MVKDIPCKSLLLPTDFSHRAGKAMFTAFEMGKPHKAKLHAPHVVKNQLLTSTPEARALVFCIIPDTGNPDRVEPLKLTKKKYKTKGNLHLQFDIPAYAIGDKTIYLNRDLIIMDMHGASGFRKLVIGNTTYALI